MTFDTAAQDTRRREGIYVFMGLDTGFPFFNIADESFAETGAVASLNPGLLDVTGITYGANFGVEQRPASLSLTIANRPYIDSISTQRKPMMEWCQGRPCLGKICKVLCMIFDKSTGLWAQHIIFTGAIANISPNGQDEIRIEAVEISTGAIPVPNKFVGTGTFDYGTDEGEIPKLAGAPIPIGVGSFSVYGIHSQSATVPWPSGHPFSSTPAGDDPDDTTTLLPSMLGVLHPIMPVALASLNYRGPSDYTPLVAPDQNYSNMYQNIYLYGSRDVAPALPVDLTRVLTSNPHKSYQWSGFMSPFQPTPYLPVMTWHDSSLHSAGMPYCREVAGDSNGDRSRFVALYQNDAQRLFGSAGNMDVPRSSATDWSTASAPNAYGIYVNSRVSTEINATNKFYGGAIQTIAFPFQGFTANPTTIGGMQFTNSAGVTNPTALMDIADLTTATTIHEGEHVSLQAPTLLPNLGKMYGVRVGCLVNINGTAVNLKMGGRFGAFDNPMIRRLPDANPEVAHRGTEHHAGISTIFNAGGADPPAAATSPLVTGAASSFITGPVSGAGSPGHLFTFWAMPPWQYLIHIAQIQSYPMRNAQPFGFATGNEGGGIAANVYPHGDYPWPACLEEWKLTSYDRQIASAGFDECREYPWDVTFWVFDGSSPREVDIYAAWIEVLYKPTLNEPQQLFKTSAAPFLQRQTHYPYRAFGRGRYVSAGLNPEEDLTKAESGVFIVGEGAQKATPSPHTIESPVEVVELLMEHYAPAAYSFRTTGAGVFGSFDDAATAHATASSDFGGSGNPRIALVVDRKSTFGKVMHEIGRQTYSMVVDALHTNGGGLHVHQMFIDQHTPDAARLYRTDGGLFTWNDIYDGEFDNDIAQSGEDISNNITVNYGWHRGAKKFSGQFFLNGDETNLLSQRTIYKTEAALSRTDYGLENPLTFELPDMWDPEEADACTKWIFSQRRRRRVSLAFSTNIRQVSLREGHIITFDDSIADHVEYSGEVAPYTWSDRKFNVVSRTYEFNRGAYIKIRVQAQETWNKVV